LTGYRSVECIARRADLHETGWPVSARSPANATSLWYRWTGRCGRLMAASWRETTFNDGKTTILKQADIEIAPKKQISEVHSTSMSQTLFSAVAHRRIMAPA
jgi:hypothetical protein